MPGEQGKINFPLPPRFWDLPGEQPSFQLWNAQFENYMFSVDSQRTAADKMSDEFKNRLLFSLLGNEAVASFACTPEALNIATTSFADFQKAAKCHFQPTMSPIHAYFDFQSRHQQEGKSVNQFCNALQTLLVDCEVATEVETKTLLACRMVFGCHDSAILQKLLALKVHDFESIFAEMESQEKGSENAKGDTWRWCKGQSVHWCSARWQEEATELTNDQQTGLEQNEWSE